MKLNLALVPPEPETQFFNNASTLIGFQLSAIFGQATNVSTACSKFNQLDTKWDDIGFNTEAIYLPWCTRQGCNIANDGLTIYSNVVELVRNLFNLELLNFFSNTKTTWLNFCKHLNSARLDVYVGDNSTIGITCGIAGSTPGDYTQIGDNTTSQAVTDDIHNAAAAVFAWEVLAFFTTPAELKTFCTEWGQYFPLLADLQLDPTPLTTITCSYENATSLPSVSELRQTILPYYTEIFATTVWSVSDDVDYQEFICAGYKTGHLTNLNPNLAQSNINLTSVNTDIIAKCQAGNVA
jgi:hypothetical protein